MNRLLAGGLALTLVGLGGYVAGVSLSYPGRALSLPAVMIGLTLVALGSGP